MRNMRDFHNPALKARGNPWGCGEPGMIHCQPRCPGPEPGLALPQSPRVPRWAEPGPSRSFPRPQSGAGGTQGSIPAPRVMETKAPPRIKPRLELWGDPGLQVLVLGHRTGSCFSAQLPKARSSSRSTQQRLFPFSSSIPNLLGKLEPVFGEIRAGSRCGAAAAPWEGRGWLWERPKELHSKAGFNEGLG